MYEYIHERVSALRHAVSVTYIVICIQGVCGYMSLHAFGFCTLFFQYVGFDDEKAGLLTACILTGAMFGSLFGGWLGDYVTKIQPYYGRLFVGQLSLFLLLPLSYIFLVLIPRDTSFAYAYAIASFVLGFVAAWPTAAVNGPVTSDILPVDSKATMFAIQVAIQGSIGALLGAPAVGWAAEKLFGFKLVSMIPSVDVPIASEYFRGFEAHRQRNIDALANSLLMGTMLPNTVCFMLYGVLYRSYKKDVDRIVAESLHIHDGSEEVLVTTDH